MKFTDVAIVGYSARLPGAPSAADVWKVISEKRCTVSSLGSDRFTIDRFLDPKPGMPGKSYTFRAGVLTDIFAFDAEDFGISPLEATQMDPQQRILLESVAHAFDHAGIDPERVAGDRTGVFVGASSADHSVLALQDPRRIEGQFMLGNTLSIFANRISHQWDFRGPSITIDTACSSGLFALHHAAEEIRRGTIDTAVVAGVNLLLSPMPFIGFSHARMLSPDGLCRPFSAEANGYVRAEGVVTFILRRAAAAIEDGDRVRSLLLGSATNNDGATRGLTVPSAVRQKQLFDDTIARLALDPDHIAFYEAHGTGTPVGDPIEAQAIGQSYGARRRHPLPIRSAKGNFGHLEPVSGLVGLLTAQLALEHRTIPATLHATTLNPRIDFSALNLDVVREARPIGDEGDALAAVSSFGFGGANAHAVLSHKVLAPPPTPVHEMQPALRLSASSETSLKALAESWRNRLTSEAPAPTVIFAANHRVRKRPLQLCVPPGAPGEMAAALDAWLEGKSSSVVTGRSTGRDGRVAFVFGGNGSVWPGMALAIFRSDPVFRRSLQRTSRIFRTLGGIDVCEVLLAEDLDRLLGDAEVDQSLLFALQIALVSALKARGLVADAMLGHSMGEVAAAAAAGAVSVETGVRIILSRSRSLAALRGSGTMAALVASEEVAAAILAELGSEAEIAAINSRSGVTISGPGESIEAVLKAARKRRIAGRRLRVDYPYHSSAVDVLEAELRNDLANIECRAPRTAFYSGWGGGPTAQALDAAYWWNNVRQPVRFAEAMQAMCEHEIRIFVEISPQPVLQSYIGDALEKTATPGAALPSLVRDQSRDATAVALEALVRGAKATSDAMLGPNVAATDDPPLYPFDRAHYKLQYNSLNILGPSADHHPLLGDRIIEGGCEWQSEISVSSLPWLADHRVRGRIVLPATAIVEMFSEAARQAQEVERVALGNLEFMRPVFLPEEGPVRLRVVHEATLRRLTLSVQQQDNWLTCATAHAREIHVARNERMLLDWGDNPASLYKALEDSGLQYGQAFRVIQSVARKDSQIDVRLAQGDALDTYGFDPVRADAPLHALGLLMTEARQASTRALLPARVDRWLHVTTAFIAGARLQVVDVTGGQLVVDVTYVDSEGSVVAEMSALQLRPAGYAGEDVPRFWSEEPVLIARQEAGRAANILRRRTALPTGASDIEILRDALGRRLVWERLRDAPTSGDEVTHETAGSDSDADCPWPEPKRLVELLLDVAPSASDELHGALAALEATRAPESNRLVEAAVALLASPTLAHHRLAVAGRVDVGLIAALGREATSVALIARDAAEAEAFDLQFGDGNRPPIHVLSGANDSDPFDVVVTLDLAGRMPESDPSALLDFLSETGVLVSFEDKPDSFSVATRRHATASAMDRLTRALERAGADVALRALAEYPTVRVLIAERRTAAVRHTPGLNVEGEGDLADALREVSRPGADSRRVRVIAGSESIYTFTLALWEVFASEAVGSGTVWIVKEGTAHAAVLHGWRRAVANETDIDVRTACVDPSADLGFVAATLMATTELEVMFERGAAYAPRLSRTEVTEASGSRLLLTKSGDMGSGRVSWIRAPRPAPSGDEIEVRVEATGLNFRDVMWANDLLPYDAVRNGYAGATLGMECAGRIVRAGPEAELSVGRRVALVAPSAFSTHVIARSATALELPEDMTFEAAACLPVAFATALFALEDLAHLQKGESVLIHAATGGVGLAALQIARRAGARVLATAGTPTKRRLLSLLGVEEVFDSRRLDFANEVQLATAGRGVDIVINSLSGDAMEASVGCLAPFGRFLELGKRDFFADRPLPLRAFRNNLSYFGVDLDQLLGHRPEAARQLFARLAKLLKEGTLTPLPHQVFAGERAVEAFDTMKRAQHIGKLVVTSPRPRKAPLAARPAPVRGNWIVFGGTSGFGLETAKWLAKRGAERLWLVSRSGSLASEANAELKRLAEIRVRACDVAEESSVRALFAEIGNVDGALNGVVHAAMVLRDKPFRDLERLDVDAVVRPKVAGGEILDRLTRVLDLEHFWLFSSVAARFGSVGQAPYVAANMALEDIALRRAAEGLPALAIAWGPITDAGYLARKDEVRRAVEKQFGGNLTASAALSTLGAFLDSGSRRATITIATSPCPALNLRTLNSPLMSAFSRRLSPRESGAVDAIVALVDHGKQDAARDLLLDLIKNEAARITRASVATIDVNRPLNEIGFDSLMGVNLLLEIEKQLGSSIAMMDGSVDLSIQKLTNRILAALTVKGHGLVAELATRHISSTELSTGEMDAIVQLAEQSDVGT